MFACKFPSKMGRDMSRHYYVEIESFYGKIGRFLSIRGFVQDSAEQIYRNGYGEARICPILRDQLSNFY
jgi:hypothetical protein